MRKIFVLSILTLALATLKSTAQDSSYQLSGHILDISLGRPAAGITVHLYRYNEISHEWDYVYQTKSDAAGRISDLLPSGNDNQAVYKLRFDTSDYFRARGEKSIYPFVEIVFGIDDKTHYHIPLLISANGYSTYRGS